MLYALCALAVDRRRHPPLAHAVGALHRALRLEQPSLRRQQLGLRRALRRRREPPRRATDNFRPCCLAPRAVLPLPRWYRGSRCFSADVILAPCSTASGSGLSGTWRCRRWRTSRLPRGGRRSSTATPNLNSPRCCCASHPCVRRRRQQPRQRYDELDARCCRSRCRCRWCCRSGAARSTCRRSRRSRATTRGWPAPGLLPGRRRGSIHAQGQEEVPGLLGAAARVTRSRCHPRATRLLAAAAARGSIHAHGAEELR